MWDAHLPDNSMHDAESQTRFVFLFFGCAPLDGARFFVTALPGTFAATIL